MRNFPLLSTTYSSFLSSLERQSVTRFRLLQRFFSVSFFRRPRSAPPLHRSCRACELLSTSKPRTHSGVTDAHSHLTQRDGGHMNREGRKPVYNFKQLAEGDSLYVVPTHPLTARRVRNAAATHKGRYPGWNFRTVTLKDGRVKVTRLPPDEE